MTSRHPRFKVSFGALPRHYFLLSPVTLSLSQICLSKYPASNHRHPTSTPVFFRLSFHRALHHHSSQIKIQLPDPKPSLLLHRTSTPRNANTNLIPIPKATASTTQNTTKSTSTIPNSTTRPTKQVDQSTSNNSVNSTSTSCTPSHLKIDN